MALRMLLFLCIVNVSLHVAATDLVVVVNKHNKINTLSKRQVIDIYMGRYGTFPDGETVQPLDLPAQSQLKNDFYLKLVNQDESKINAYWARLLFSGRAKPPETVKSVEEILRKLQKSELSIAYIPETELTDNIKVVYRLNEN